MVYARFNDKGNFSANDNSDFSKFKDYFKKDRRNMKKSSSQGSTSSKVVNINNFGTMRRNVKTQNNLVQAAVFHSKDGKGGKSTWLFNVDLSVTVDERLIEGTQLQFKGPKAIRAGQTQDEAAKSDHSLALPGVFEPVFVNVVPSPVL